jgi:neutral ceramidase
MKKTLFCRTWGFVLLSALAAVASGADSGALRVGAARVEYTQLTPPPLTPPLGKYDHEKLFVRAIVLDNGLTRAALINVDGNAPGTIPAKVAAELKCPVANVIASGTHSHSAGMGGASSQQGASPLEDVALDAVRQAVKKLQPARMSFGTGLAYINANRDGINPHTRLWTQETNLHAPSDKTVAVLKFESPSGEPIALYINYAGHPVNGYLAGITSADYPGAASRYIEQIYEDRAVAVFTQGAEGDQNPLYLRASAGAMLRRLGQKYSGQPLIREEVEAKLRANPQKLIPLDAKEANDLEKAIEATGIIFAEEVLRVVDSLPAGFSDVRIAGAQKTITCPGRTRLNPPPADQPRDGSPATYEDGPDVTILTGVLGIGNVALAAVQGEAYNRIAQGFKAKSPMANSVYVGLANGSSNSGYIPSDDAFGHYTFQVLGSRLKPGCAETSIQNALVEMVTQYMNESTRKEGRK